MDIAQTTLDLVRIQSQDFLHSTQSLSMLPGLVYHFPRALSLMSPAQHPEMLCDLPVTSTLQIPTKDMLSYQLYLCPTQKKILTLRALGTSLLYCHCTTCLRGSCRHISCIVTTHQNFPPPTTDSLWIKQLDHHWSVLSIKQKAPPVDSLDIPSTYGHKVQIHSLTSAYALPSQETASCGWKRPGSVPRMATHSLHDLKEATCSKSG